MKGYYKALIVGLIIIILGVCVFLVGLSLNDWKFDFNVRYEMAEQTVDGDFNTIDIDMSVGEVEICYYDGQTAKIEYPKSDSLHTTIEVVGGELKFGVGSKKFILFVNFGSLPKTIISLPKGKSYNLNADLSAGSLTTQGKFGLVDIELSAGKFQSQNLECDKFSLDLSAGSAKVDLLKSENIGLDVSAGSAELGLYYPESDYTITVDKSAGSCNAVSRVGGDKRLDIDVSAGSVNISFGKAV